MIPKPAGSREAHFQVFRPLATALTPLRAHPGLSLQLLLDDAVIDLIAARVDIALRVGALPDSTLVARKPGAAGGELLETCALRMQGRVQASQVTALHALCLASWDISIAVSDDDRRALADGRLLPVLPGWRLPDLPVHGVTPRRGEQPAKVRHALDLLAVYFASAATA